MKSLGHFSLKMLLLNLLVSASCETRPAELIASVKGQQYGTIEVFKMVFATDSLFNNPVKNIYFANPASNSGGVDFPYRPACGGKPSAHMGCLQSEGYPGRSAKLIFDNINFKKGSVLWVRILYSKNSPESDSFTLHYNNALLISFVPTNRNSWDDYHSEDFKIKIP